MASESEPTESQGESGEPTELPRTWIDAMEEVFESAVDRQAEIEVEFDNMDVKIPLQLGDEPSYADWKLNGSMKVRLNGISGPLAEWLRYYTRGELPPQLLERMNESGSDSDE